MSNLITAGIVLAILSFVVYASKRWGFVEAEKEIEKATSRESQKVAIDKLESLEKTALEAEAATREKEAQEIENAHKNETVTRTTIGFYPVRVLPKKPNDLN